MAPDVVTYSSQAFWTRPNWTTIMAADHNPVKLVSKPKTASPTEETSGVSPWERTPPGITASELIAAVGNLEMPGGGFADALEAVQASQPLAEMPEWPDWPQTMDRDAHNHRSGEEL
jgi:hypothetical protein